VRQSGSHLRMEGQVDGKRMCVTIPEHDSIQIGTLVSIIRQSGLPRRLFEAEN
jgi:predicted RNA binding protein YcfA (HicA-like mRNA interferase family)